MRKTCQRLTPKAQSQEADTRGLLGEPHSLSTGSGAEEQRGPKNNTGWNKQKTHFVIMSRTKIVLKELEERNC